MDPLLDAFPANPFILSTQKPDEVGSTPSVLGENGGSEFGDTDVHPGLNDWSTPVSYSVPQRRSGNGHK